MDVNGGKTDYTSNVGYSLLLWVKLLFNWRQINFQIYFEKVICRSIFLLGRGRLLEYRNTLKEVKNDPSSHKN